ncbi:hypothetical protein ACFL6E_07200 [Candidatus Neomarinimicrobiota bacterium]
MIKSLTVLNRVTSAILFLLTIQSNLSTLMQEVSVKGSGETDHLTIKMASGGGYVAILKKMN